MEIRYAMDSSPLGRLLVAATEHGIAALYLGDSEQKLRLELAREFPDARIREDRHALGELAAAIVNPLRRRQPLPDLPLDLRATAFQRRVWEELRRIPYGSTCSYSQIARAIGKPKAVRAVARACATNSAAIIIPCHRVVGKNGSLTGYRWGTDRKRALQEMESKTNPRGRMPAPRHAESSRGRKGAASAPSLTR